MTSRRSILFSIVAAGTVAASVAWLITNQGIDILGSPRAAPSAQPRPQWTATAPGRVEPRGGEVRLSAPSAGRVVEVAARVNDRIFAGDLLVRLDDDDARARIAAADAELAARRRERDAETVSRLAQDRRQAEDGLANAERALLNLRVELDRLARQQRADPRSVSDELLASQRSAVTAAQERVEQERASLRRSQTAAGVPAQTRAEASVTAARSDIALAEAAFERSRLRAPSDGTVLQVGVRAGEMAAPSPEQVLVVIGDLTALRVRAEVEERDIAKVRTGQAVIVRADAFPGREFTGRVAAIAPTIAPGRIAQRGPRRPSDHDTLEVMIDLDPGAALLPGMRVDVFFKADATAETAPPIDAK